MNLPSESLHNIKEQSFLQQTSISQSDEMCIHTEVGNDYSVSQPRPAQRRQHMGIE